MSDPATPSHRASGQRWVLAVATLVLLALAIMIAVSPRILIYDERYYMESSYYLAAHFAWTGPLYPHLHVLLSPLTQLQVPAVRYVNSAALAVTLACCW